MIKAGRASLCAIIALCFFTSLWSQESADDSLPKVALVADNVGPRQIEELTSKSVPRDYAYAWKTMAEALEGNRPNLLGAYFAGFAKDNLVQRIADQKRTGIHVIHREQVNLQYLVLMTPGADRWLVRDLETTPEVHP